MKVKISLTDEEDKYLVLTFLLWCRSQIYKQGNYDDAKLADATNYVAEFFGKDVLYKNTVKKTFKSIKKAYRLIEEGEL